MSNKRFISSAHDGLPDEDRKNGTKKGIVRYLPLCFLIFLILVPHPSWLLVLVKYHLVILNEPLTFTIHLLASYALTFLAFSSLIICIVRDPGPVNFGEDSKDETEEVGITQALMSADDDYSAPGRWCRKCWAPKYERTHHCTTCDRCVLKMDHHCLWIASKCIGHRTYPAFVYFLCTITLLATYISVVSASAFWFAFNNPLSIDEITPVHELFLAFYGITFSMVIGSFFGYHLYLISTNQTTLENISPFILLRDLPKLPPSGDTHRFSDPPLEHELSYEQRRLVRYAHGYIHLYDVGWRKNWAQVFGWEKEWGWIWRLTGQGGGKGNGRNFPRNPRSTELLARLAAELVKADKDR